MVRSQPPALEICRLLFNFCSNTRDRLSQYSVLPPLMTLTCLSNTTYLRTLSIGIKTSHILERLLVCIPLIENLSVGVHDSENTISPVQFALILKLVYNIHILEIDDEDGNLVHALLNNEDNLGTIVNRPNLISTKF
ncbi:unnamed protein product [Rotaria sordida]|uniref:Uncharacterized protein n=1 Tax=Rotaria sordida TaxID=392033 RepID=A0A819NKV9_9BILA|nr:unnamed protein product [Rotaria sordida]